jgi:nucleotide-binding universal stress UspA family protein
MRILALVDFSELADGVVAEAAALARTFGAQLVVAHAARTEPVLTSAGVAPPGAGRVPPEDLPQRRKLLDELAARVRAPGLEVRAVLQLADGDLDAECLAIAKEQDARYVVVGSNGHATMYEVIVGSVTRGVIRGAKVPVVVVPRGAAPR